MSSASSSWATRAYSSHFNSCMVLFLNHFLGLPHMVHEQNARLSAILPTVRLHPHFAATARALFFIRSRLCRRMDRPPCLNGSSVCMVPHERLELPTSRSVARRSCSIELMRQNWMPDQVSNLKPPESESGVLPIELSGSGVLGEIRTHDLLLRRQTLYPAELREQKRCPSRGRTHITLVQCQVSYR